MASTVGFIGLGNMGSHMARHLLRAGRRVVVNDVCSDAMQRLEEAGASVASSPAALASAVGDGGSVITMLPSGANVRDVYAETLAAPGFSAKLLIDCSTCEPATATTVAGWAAKANAAFVDAPVSGGVGGAQQASLTFMVGAADEAAVGLASPLLLEMGKSVVHCGGVGSGQAVKLCNNLVLAVSMLGVSEGMLLGERLGVDKHTLAQVRLASRPFELRGEADRQGRGPRSDLGLTSPRPRPDLALTSA